MSLSEFSAPLPRMPGKGERRRRRSPPSVTIRHESLPGVEYVEAAFRHPNSIRASTRPDL
jgi:hypothetical protein